MTTVTLDDSLGKVASQVAAAQGKTLDEFVVDLLRSAVAPVGQAQQTMRNGLPVMLTPETSPVIEADRIQRRLEEEGF